MKTKVLWLFGLLSMLGACEKAYIAETTENDTAHTLRIRVSNLQTIPFASSVQTKKQEDIGNVCTRLNFAIFQDETKVKAINQKAGDQDFGTVTLSLPEGDYRLVVIAHSSDGNASISTPSKITFPSNHITDTFYCYGSLQVDGQGGTHDVELERAVAMFRLVTTDDAPADVAKMRFYYTGGSSTFDATTGYGNVNSRQTEVLSIGAADRGKPLTLEVYTFPHDQTGTLKMTVSALDTNDNTLAEKEFENVTIQQNMITQYSGSFFTADPMDDSFKLTADTEWEGTNETTF